MLAVVGHVARKELRQILRDRRSLVLILVMPIILTFLFGKALETGELGHIPSVILNLDGSSESNRIASAFRTYDEVLIEREVSTLTEAQDLLARGQIKAAIVIPKGFLQQIEAGDEAQLLVLLDGTDNTSAPIVEGVAVQNVAGHLDHDRNFIPNPHHLSSGTSLLDELHRWAQALKAMRQ